MSLLDSASTIVFPEYRSITLMCPCGAIGPDEIQDAFADGWRSIDQDDESGTGVCPECR